MADDLRLGAFPEREGEREPSEKTQNRPTALRSAMRMFVYSALGVVLVCVLALSSRVHEEYYHFCWTNADEESQQAKHFAALVKIELPKVRLTRYWEQRAFEVLPSAFKLPDHDPSYIGLPNRMRAAWSWGTLGEAVEMGFGATLVPALSKALRDGDQDTRYSAVQALNKLGFAARGVTPALIRALRDTNDANLNVRYWAAQILGEIGSSAGESVPALIHALRNDGASVRYSSALALGKITPATPHMVDALEQALCDPDTSVHAAAMKSLKDIAKRPVGE